MAHDKISILGPRHDGTYVVEFKTAAGKKLAITVPEAKTAVLKHFPLATAELHAPMPDEGATIQQLGLHLKNLVALTTGQSRFLRVGGLRREALEQGWRESCRGMEFALNFLRNNAGINSPALLSSPFMLITLGYYGHKRDYTLAPIWRLRRSPPGGRTR